MVAYWRERQREGDRESDREKDREWTTWSLFFSPYYSIYEVSSVSRIRNSPSLVELQ